MLMESNDPLVPRAYDPEELTDDSFATRDEFNPLKFAKPSFDAAVERFKSAGVTEVDKEDPALFNAYKRSVDYFADMGLAGLELTDAAFKAAIGTVAEAIPGQTDQDEQRFERDVYEIPTALAGMGAAPLGLTDDVIEQSAKGLPVASRMFRESEAGHFGPEAWDLLPGSPQVVREGRNNSPALDAIVEAFGEEYVFRDNKLVADPDSDYEIEYELPDKIKNLTVSEVNDYLVDDLSHDEVLDRLGLEKNENNYGLANLLLTYTQDAGLTDFDYVYTPRRSISPTETTTNPEDFWINPVDDFLENVEIPSKGIKGSELLKRMQQDPQIRGSFLSSLNLGIDPQKRYTDLDLENMRDRAGYNVVVSDPSDTYRGYQRQSVHSGYFGTGPTEKGEKDYFEITVEAAPSNVRVNPRFRANSQHFENTTLAHTRASLREDDGGEYILVEELQSDLLQHGYAKPSPGESVDEFIERTSKDVKEQLSGMEDIVAADDVNLDNWEKDEDLFITEPVYTRDEVDSAVDYVTDIQRINFDTSKPGIEESDLRAVLEKHGKDADKLLDTWRLNNNRLDVLFQTDAERNANVFFKQSGFPKSAAGAPPIKRTKESVDVLLKALISTADERGVDRIIIPPFEKIVEARFAKGSPEYEKAIDPKSGFYQTYVKALDSSLKELEANYGENVRIDRGQQLLYKDEGLKDRIHRGIEINIRGLGDQYDLSRPRFNKGGMVEMQEGGMTDSGAEIDPVSGNEVPPGSLPEEVRDQVDAKLSPGEYVVPADVLQYYGMKFFEDLRAQAKADLQRMDQEGRIGGEPEVKGEELTADEMAMLQEVMQQGVPAERNFNDGGLVGQGTFNPADWQAVGFGGGQGNVSGVTEYKTYVGPGGEIQLILFKNGKPVTPIPAGFKEQTEATPEQPVETKKKDDDDNQPQVLGQDMDVTNRWLDANYEALNNDPVQVGLDALENNKLEELAGGNVGKALGIAAGPVGAGLLTGFNTITELNNLAQARASRDIAAGKGLDTSELDQRISKAEEGLSRIGGLFEGMGAAQGTNILESFNQRQGSTTTPTPTSSPTPTTTSAPRPKKDDRESFAEKMRREQQEEQEQNTQDIKTEAANIQQTAKEQGTTVHEQTAPGANYQAVDEAKPDYNDPRRGMFNRGGLVQKRRRGRSYKKKNKKGLASKQ